MSKTTNKFSPEIRDRAVRLVLENESQHGSRWQAVMSISAKIGCSAHTLNQWVKKAEVDSGKRAGIAADVAERLKVLERENRARPTRSCARRRRRSAARTGGAADRLCDGGARPPTETMIAFIDAHRGQHGVDPICRVLPIAPSTYYDHLAKRSDPTRLSDRARRDAVLRPEIERVFEENGKVYGVRKVWRQLGREGFSVARSTVARLMKEIGIQGVIRGKPCRTTIPDKKAPCPLDKVNRQFRAGGRSCWPPQWLVSRECIGTRLASSFDRRCSEKALFRRLWV